MPICYRRIGYPPGAEHRIPSTDPRETMYTELIRIPTATYPLDGLYYTPNGPPKGGVLYFHGNQMNFYVCAARFLMDSRIL